MNSGRGKKLGMESGPGKNKRKWTDKEDMKLIGALLDLHNTGKYNTDRGFKLGHFQAVEKILANNLPSSGLKVDPHIKSRMKTLKTHFDVVHDMLNASGFGYEEMKQCVVAEKAVWDAYLQSHKNAVNFKDKCFPHYKELCIILGKDRATSKEAATSNDVLEALEDEELNKEKEVDNDDVESPLDDILISPIIGNTSETSSKKKRKKRSQSGEEMILEVVKSSSSFIGSKMDSSSERISRAIEDASVKDMKLKLNEELKKLSGFSMVERHRATPKLARDHDLLDIFFTIEDEEKEAWVKEVVL